MTQLVIRQSGGANIVSIPKAILKTLGLHVGSALELAIIDQKIGLSPVSVQPTLQSLLDGSPKAKLKPTAEDREWINAKPAGKEVL